MKRIAAGGIGLVVVALAAILIYFNFVRDDAPEAFELTEPATAETDTTNSGGTETTAGSGSDGAATTDGASAAPADGGSADPIALDGTWLVGAGSEAGYRVVEDLRGIQDFEAVGRTEEVTGTVEITGTTITEAAFEVDVAAIASDDGRRDSQFRGAIMNAAEFPTAAFVLGEPIELGSPPEPGSPVSTTATGELTLRGVTNVVTFPVDAQLLEGRIEIVGSIDVLFSDYGIDNPSNAVVTVRDEGKVEVRLLLDKG